MTEPASSRTVHLGQFRLTRLQLVNWGTFCGYKDFRIDDRGVLLTGPSGSGKSSLMDAHSLVLLPTHDQRFNASADLTARGSKRNTRTVADYVRGAWSETNDENEHSQVRYLRGGVPTWSAVAATYDDGRGAVTTAVVVKWFTGVENDGAAMSTLHQLNDGDFDMQELNGWADRTFDTRWWKSVNPAAQFPPTQDKYMTELAKRIGLSKSRTALALLGKAKAMKNVGDLNLFIRDNMLDRPDTFNDAQHMLSAFTPLNEAYETAKRANAQAQVLHDLPESWRTYRESAHTIDRATNLRGAGIERYVRGLLLSAIQRELDEIDTEVQSLDAVIGDQKARSEAARAALIELQMQLNKENQSLRALETRHEALLDQARAARLLYRQYSGHVTKLGEPCPQDTEGFERLRIRLPELRSVAAARAENLTPTTHAAIAAEYVAAKAHREAAEELARLRSAKSLMPGPAIDRRARISAETGVPIADLPYAAELIDMAEGHERWRAAAEKVLRSYGMRMLVPQRHKEAVRRFIDQHDMRGVIEYSVVTAVSAHEPRPLPTTLAGKLTVDRDHPHGRWLADQMTRRFNHVCVESAHDLDDHQIAVTVNGTVKLHANHYRKDDRPELTSTSSYILGANTIAKRRALEADIQELADQKKIANDAALDLQDQLEEANRHRDAATQLTGFTTWTELDHWTPNHDASELGDRIDEIRSGNVDLQELEAKRDKAADEDKKAYGIWHRTEQRIAEITTRETTLVDLQSDEERRPHALDTDDQQYLDELYASTGVIATVDTIDNLRRQLLSTLDKSVGIANGERQAARERVRSAITRFLDQWRDSAPDDSGDVDRSGQDFADLHAEIVQRRFPEAMRRFEKMISEDMVPSIAMLQRSIENAATEIERRVGMVNVGLRRVEFNTGTHLQISYTTNSSVDIKAFRSSVDTLMRKAAQLGDDPQRYVEQFKRVKALMAKFTAADTAAERWRRNVLDVRNGYAFYGREVEGEITKHTYRNTASNSGGEQEKLVAFCLAAALSYNLADDQTDARPRFGTLMLDEAFSKSDENFSAQALSAFDEFGFQLVIAAPIRLSGIVEPYIGQAILVEKRLFPDGTRSHGRSATFGELAAQRFAESDGATRASA
ncbi:ATP-binding protein [Nocardia suismassiliense]|uniref:ATP-binding protein n=1 Tax=Nocardia suismassiliense TaxID=2077092 RepID=A0ABW6QXS8_9NOCA